MAYSEKEKKQIIEALASQVEAGLALNQACIRVGIPRKTVWEWEKKDSSIRNKVRKSRINLESKIVGNILKASGDPRHWTAGAWLLERMNRKRWGKHEEIRPTSQHITQINFNAVPGDLQKLSDQFTEYLKKEIQQPRA